MVECYIRPIIYYGFEELKSHAEKLPDRNRHCRLAWAHLKMTWCVFIPDIIRLHPLTSVVDAKISGHYVNSMLAGREAMKRDLTRRYCLTMRATSPKGLVKIFMIKDSKVITPTTNSILPGITKFDSNSGRDLGYQVEERSIKRDEAYSADECFLPALPRRSPDMLN